MSMQVGGEGGDDKPMSDINTTPLVDVMLVLLIIFLITVPAAIQKIPVKLPDVRFDPTTTKPENVSLSIRGGKAGCEVYWNQTQVHADELSKRAVERLKREIDKIGGPQNLTPENFPEAHIRGDVDTPYKCIGGAIFVMQSAGFQKVGFISEPPAGSGTVERF